MRKIIIITAIILMCSITITYSEEKKIDPELRKKANDLIEKLEKLEDVERFWKEEGTTVTTAKEMIEQKRKKDQIYEELRKIGTPAVFALTRHLENKDPIIRKKAVSILGELGHREAVNPLVNMLKDRDYEVKSYAAWALGRIRDKRAVKPLVKSLKDRNSEVRSKAAVALGEIGDGSAIPYLIKALGDRAPEVRGMAAYSLGHLKASAAVPYLINLLDDTGKVGEGAVFTGLSSSKFTLYVHNYASSALKQITNQSFGFEGRVLAKRERKENMRKWREWWEKNKDSFELESK